MDPRPAPGGPRRSRLPRTRGDGPHTITYKRRDKRAPPHPRGWTPVLRPHRGPDAGSPAPAGMDPRIRSRSRPAAWLPRTRGDGPEPRDRPQLHHWAPPHPRGWTRYRRYRHMACHGSPAPAGMDPRCSSRSPPSVGSPAPAGMDPFLRSQRRARVWLPRTRGDGPEISRGGKVVPRAPPHPRGWTRLHDRERQGHRGSPAPAGMDPRYGDPAERPGGLPRTRGDGPLTSLHQGCRRPAPPHPRGWTRVDLARPGASSGSPAPAGMDPRTGAPFRSARRLPRTRGDGPHQGAAETAERGAPPHPRGWTGLQGRPICLRQGSPAPAGMDPRSSRSPRPVSRLPRTRGDGPWMMFGTESEGVAPPHPRDGPPGRCSAAWRWQAPPHPRGWTLSDRSGRIAQVGSPAPAGMDPRSNDN